MPRDSYSDKVYLLSYPRLYMKSLIEGGLGNNMSATGDFIQQLQSRGGYIYFQGDTKVTITWKSKGDKKYVKFNYNLIDTITKKEYLHSSIFNLISKKSNLPNNLGYRWYFQDERSGVLSTYLIFTGGGLKIRDPKKYYYPSQILSHQDRVTHQYNLSKFDKINYEQYQTYYGKNTKSHYRGKKTKKQILVDEKLVRYERGFDKMEQIMMRQFKGYCQKLGIEDEFNKLANTK